MSAGEKPNDSMRTDHSRSGPTNADGSHTNPTADYRKYPKGPNFGLIVGLFCATILIALIAAWLVLRTHPRMVPDAHGPQKTTKSISTPEKNGH